jgi:hypothetical protein
VLASGQVRRNFGVPIRGEQALGIVGEFVDVDVRPGVRSPTRVRAHRTTSHRLVPDRSAVIGR